MIRVTTKIIINWNDRGHDEASFHYTEQGTAIITYMPFQLLCCAPNTTLMYSYTTGIFKVRIEMRITRKLVVAISEADCFISLRTKLKRQDRKTGHRPLAIRIAEAQTTGITAKKEAKTRIVGPKIRQTPCRLCGICAQSHVTGATVLGKGVGVRPGGSEVEKSSYSEAESYEGPARSSKIRD